MELLSLERRFRYCAEFSARMRYQRLSSARRRRLDQLVAQRQNGHLASIEPGDSPSCSRRTMPTTDPVGFNKLRAGRSSMPLAA